MAWRRLEETVGWPAFLLFFLAGGLLAFGFVGAASIGLFFLPLGMVLFGLLIAYAPDHRDRWGVFAGVGAVGILIGILNLNYRRCGEGSSTVRPGEESLSCGGFHPLPWLAIGVFLIALSLVVYHRSQPNTITTDPT